MRGWHVSSVRAKVGRDRMYLGLRVTRGSGVYFSPCEPLYEAGRKSIGLERVDFAVFAVFCRRFSPSATRVMNRKKEGFHLIVLEGLIAAPAEECILWGLWGVQENSE